MRRRGVVDGPAGTAIAALREGQCTLAITAAEIPDPRLELEALSFVRRAAIAAATHPLAARSRSGEPLTGAELADHVQIVVPDPSHLTGGARFRRVVSRNVQRDQARTDPCRCRLGKPAAVVSRVRPSGRSARPNRGRRVWAAGRNVCARLIWPTGRIPPGPAARAFRQALLWLADETASRPQRMTKNAQKATRSRGSRSRQS